VCRAVFDAAVTLRPWFDRLVAEVPGVSLFDAHTHVGQNDPDGFKQTTDELLEGEGTVLFGTATVELDFAAHVEKV
jgi:hypothetical protein